MIAMNEEIYPKHMIKSILYDEIYIIQGNLHYMMKSVEKRYSTI